MSAQPATKQNPSNRSVRRLKFTRKRVLAATLVVIALLLFFHGGSTLDHEVYTILTLEAGNLANVAQIQVPTLAFLQVTGVFFLAAGVLGLLDLPGLQRFSNGMMILSGVLFIPTILITAAAGGSTNIITMLAESLRLATPIAIGAMAGLWCERSGVVNIAIEGMMLFAACFGFTTFFFLKDVFAADQVGIAMVIAVAIAVLSGGLAALLHAWLSITFATDQIVSGTVINILAVGVTSFVRREFLLSTDAGTLKLPAFRIPVLADIPVIGEVLFNNQPIFYLMFVIIIVSHVVLFYTRWGLRVRSVGEEPAAADTLGINVNRTRWISVFIGGLIAGLAGAWFSLELTGRFNDMMTGGKGFIALAALIFGKWTPFGAFGGALLFGFADALGTRFQILNVAIPVQFLQMVPYAVTLIVLAGLVGRATPPKAIGQPYEKE